MRGIERPRVYSSAFPSWKTEKKPSAETTNRNPEKDSNWCASPSGQHIHVLVEMSECTVPLFKIILRVGLSSAVTNQWGKWFVGRNRGQDLKESKFCHQRDLGL